MKALILALLLVSALCLGCGQQTQQTSQVVSADQATEANVVAEVDKTTIPANQEVEIGEMI